MVLRTDSGIWWYDIPPTVYSNLFKQTVKCESIEFLKENPQISVEVKLDQFSKTTFAEARFHLTFNGALISTKYLNILLFHKQNK